MTGWTEERVTRAKKLWLDGLSASEIARDLKDVSRNAVIGVIHRAGLSGKGPQAREARPSAPRRIVEKPTALLKAPPVARNPNGAAGVNLRMDSKAAAADPNRAHAGNVLNFQTGPKRAEEPRAFRPAPATGIPARIVDAGFHGCRWPINDPGRGNMDETLFCCGPKALDDKSYCAAHRKIATSPYQPKKPKSPPPLGAGTAYRFDGGSRRFAE